MIECKTCGGPNESTFLNCESCRKLNRDRVSRYYVAHPDKKSKTPAVARRDNLRSRHGLTEAELVVMMEAQDWKCLICTGILDLKHYHIDHDHFKDCCGESRSCANCRRGILCSRCNTLVGRVETNMDLMPKIFEYIGAV
jgi:hypothetical protein